MPLACKHVVMNLKYLLMLLSLGGRVNPDHGESVKPRIN
jgi:hypothetical protein